MMLLCRLEQLHFARTVSGDAIVEDNAAGACSADTAAGASHRTSLPRELTRNSDGRVGALHLVERCLSEGEPCLGTSRRH
jgi:hypothetical protein